MNTSKKILFLLILMLIITPNYKVSAEQKSVTVYCFCEYDGSNITCPETCEVESINKSAAIECGGRDSEIHSVKYYCNPYTEFGVMTPNSNREGTTPYNSCQNYVSNESISVSDKISLKVAAKATCTPKPEILGEFICEEPDILRALTFVGYLLFFVKLLIPFIIILMGTMDYYKAVVSEKDDDLKKQTSVFIKRIILGIVVFFIPTILNTFMVLISDYNETASKYENCVTCVLDPNSCNE